MAKLPRVQYIRYYVPGSAAQQLEPTLFPRKRTNPQVRQKAETENVIAVDPLAITGIVLAVVMLVLMLVGMNQMYAARMECEEMEAYMQTLLQTNGQLQQTYLTGYDLQSVEEQALALGMVPMEDVLHITISAPPVTVEPEPTFWQQICAFVDDLFA